MQFFKPTLLVAVAFTDTLVAASPAPSPESVARSCPWQEYGQACTYNSDCACLDKVIASVSALPKPSTRIILANNNGVGLRLRSLPYFRY